MLSKATVFLQLGRAKEAGQAFSRIHPKTLHQRQYLYHGCYTEYYSQIHQPNKALIAIDQAISSCTNQFERQYLERKRDTILGSRFDVNTRNTD